MKKAKPKSKPKLKVLPKPKVEPQKLPSVEDVVQAVFVEVDKMRLSGQEHQFLKNGFQAILKSIKDNALANTVAAAMGKKR